MLSRFDGARARVRIMRVCAVRECVRGIVRIVPKKVTLSRYAIRRYTA